MLKGRYGCCDVVTQGKKSAARQRRRHKRIAAVLVTVTLIIWIIIITAVYKTVTRNQGSAALKGVWVYDEYTQYEFDGKNKGCMSLESLQYEFEYTADGEILSIDFEDNSVRDCKYKYNVENNKLTFVGGEGTVGGTYILNKSE